MTTAEFRAILAAHPEARMHRLLPDRAFVPEHDHITEVGRLRKDFIDCGGTIRSVPSCLLRIWVADDKDHRLRMTKLAKIMDIAGAVLHSDELPVEVKYEEGTISQYPVTGVEVTPPDCRSPSAPGTLPGLAWEKCGVGGGGCR